MDPLLPAILSACFTGVIAFLTFLSVRLMRIALEEGSRAAVNVAVIRGRKPEALRQNITILFRNDGEFPAYNADFEFRTRHAGKHHHHIPILDPGCYDVFQFGPSFDHGEVAEDLRKWGITMSFQTHTGRKVTKKFHPSVVLTRSADDEGRDERGFIIEPKPMNLELGLDQY